MKRNLQTKLIQSFFLLLSLATIFPFQNCSNAKFSDVPVAESSNAPLNLSTAKTKSVAITGQPYKVDFLLVIDNSGSMMEDALHLGSRLSTFFTSLDSAHIDWQMCIIDTNPLRNGSSYRWVGASSGFTINAKTPNLGSVVYNTIESLFGPDMANGDERGIAMSYRHLNNLAHQSCYREHALFSPIYISDEDERSTGGEDYSWANPDPDLRNVSTGEIENEDRPEVYLNLFKSKFPNKKFQAHAIVIKSGDMGCFMLQNSYSNVSYGKYYESLVGLSKGTSTSICEPDYTRNLDQISTQIIILSQNIQLECAPSNSIQMTVAPADPSVQFKVIEKNILLTYPSNRSYSVQFKYNCK